MKRRRSTDDEEASLSSQGHPLELAGLMGALERECREGWARWSVAATLPDGTVGKGPKTPKPRTPDPNPTLQTPTPKPQTPNPKPQTPTPKPGTLSSNPLTLNPKP